MISCNDGKITKFSEQAMGPEMEERGPVSNQMKTEKGEISNGPTKTDETMKTDEGKKSGDQSQNGQLRTAGEGKDEGKGNKKEVEQGGDTGEESLLRRIIRRVRMKAKAIRKRWSKAETPVRRAC